MAMMPKSMVEKIGKSGIIAVLVIDEPDKAVQLARVLVDNGISSMELTLRTEGALEAIRRITKEVPSMVAGAGTIIRPEQVGAVKESGVHFGVSPGCNRKVLESARQSLLPFAPGICTPSDIEQALEFDCDVLKYFHAEGSGGLGYLKGINSPYGFLKLRYIPLGGLTAANMVDYLEMPEVLAIGGSWIAPRDSIRNSDWKTIGANAKEAYDIFKKVRGIA